MNRDQFMEIYKSSAIDFYTPAATKLQALFKINVVPTLVIVGRYVTSPTMVAKGSLNLARAQLQDATQQMLDAIVAKAKRGKPPAPSFGSPCGKRNNKRGFAKPFSFMPQPMVS